MYPENREHAFFFLPFFFFVLPQTLFFMRTLEQKTRTRVDQSLEIQISAHVLPRYDAPLFPCSVLVYVGREREREKKNRRL